MEFNRSSIRTDLMIPLLVAGILFTGCSNDEPEGAVGTDRMEQGTIGADGRPVEDDGTGDRTRSADAANAAHDPERGAEGSGVDRETTAKIEAARVEKKRNSDELNGLRSQLMAELEQVRARLNDGATPAEERSTDQARAATLAQGLERLDRALEEIEATADATWSDIKDKSNKEVEELRAWMKENDVKPRS